MFEVVNILKNNFMINTQLAFITSSAIAGITEHLDLDILKEKYDVSEEQIKEAKVASNNITVKQATNKNIASIINFVKSEGISVSELYAATWNPSNKTNHSTSDYSKGGTSGTGSMCHYNCHTNCHGSRGWR